MARPEDSAPIRLLDWAARIWFVRDGVAVLVAGGLAVWARLSQLPGPVVATIGLVALVAVLVAFYFVGKWLDHRRDRKSDPQKTGPLRPGEIRVTIDRRTVEGVTTEDVTQQSHQQNVIIHAPTAEAHAEAIPPDKAGPEED